MEDAAGGRNPRYRCATELVGRAENGPSHRKFTETEMARAPYRALAETAEEVVWQAFQPATIMTRVIQAAKKAEVADKNVCPTSYQF